MAAFNDGRFGDYLHRVAPTVDATIARLAKVRFREDPIAGRRYSRATSIVSSAYKRHGPILELALLERLSDNPRLSVWREEKFRLSQESGQEVGHHDNLQKLLSIQLPYGAKDRAITMDAIVFDRKTQTLRAYDIRRGNGQYDAVKSHAIRAELLRVNMLLSSYGESRGYKSNEAKALAIFYYGIRSLPEDLCLVGEELDEHFGFEVSAAIEVVNEYFRYRLHQLIEDEAAP